jgi:SAM-dependent methyltransferase
MTYAHGTAVPNHHAHHAPFSGARGILAGLTMVWGRAGRAKLAADLTGLTELDHVVDIGCGPGAFVREARHRGARVTGVDPAPTMLTLAKLLTRKDTLISWVEGSAEALPLPDASATVLWSVATVHHWTDVDQGVKEAHRVLQPNGRLLAIERRVSDGATGHASHGWTIDQAETFARICEACGFEGVRTETHAADGHPVVSVQGVRPSATSGAKDLAGASGDLDVLAGLHDEDLGVGREP